MEISTKIYWTILYFVLLKKYPFVIRLEYQHAMVLLFGVRHSKFQAYLARKDSWNHYLMMFRIISLVICQPFINQPPSDLTTIYTALHFAADVCRKLNQTTCFVIFYQPLYDKARHILAAEQRDSRLKNVKVRLGGFHISILYFRSNGLIMDDSELDDLWAILYASNSTKKMMTGHAFARTLRAHILSFTTNCIHICRQITVHDKYKNPFFNIFEQMWKPSYESQENIFSPPDYNSILENFPSYPSIDLYNANNVVKSVTALFVQQLNNLEKNGPTSKLWLQYLKMVITLLQFIKAERLDNWKLHLQSIQAM